MTAALVTREISSSMTVPKEESKKAEPKGLPASTLKVAPIVKKVFVEITGLVTFKNDLNQTIRAVGIKLLEKRTATNLDYLSKILIPGRGGVLVSENGVPKTLQMSEGLQEGFLRDNINLVLWDKGDSVTLIESAITFKGLTLEIYKNLCTAALKP